MIIPYLTGKLIVRILWDLVHIVKSYNDYYCSSSPPTLMPGRPFRHIFISVLKLYSLHHLPVLYFHSFLQRKTKSVHKGVWKSCAGADTITRGDSSFPVEVKLATIANGWQADSSSSLSPSLGPWKLVLISQQIPFAQNPMQHCPRQLLPVVGSDIQVEIYWHPI